MKRFAIPLALLGLLAGCRSSAPPSSPLIDWDRRVGLYTYNLALVDLGTPEHSVGLSDGTVVADWITREETPGSTGLNPSNVPSIPPFQENNLPNDIPPTPNRHLRLTFGPDGKLAKWGKYWSYGD